METNKTKILLVETDPAVIEMLIEAFIHRFNSNITCVSSAEDALDVEIVEPHTIVVASSLLPGMDVVTMTRQLTELADRPVILLGSSPSAEDVIDAMRAGAADYFAKPFEISMLLDAMERAMAVHANARTLIRRHQHLRSLVRRVIRERRELNQRVDLICKDLVGAHKRLVLRVLDRENATSV